MRNSYQSIGEMKEGRDDGQWDEMKGKWINWKIVCLDLLEGFNLNFKTEELRYS